MSFKPVTLFRIFGLPVRLHVTGLALIAVLVTVMASDLQREPDAYAATTAWLVAGAVVLGLFASLVAHELSHALVARRFGMRVRGITLFLLGGVAEMEDEPSSPWTEFLMAIAGPLMSVLLAGVFGLAWWLGSASAWPAPVGEALVRLAQVNAMLAAFNMIPAYPLDGGRVLRAILWGATGRLGLATRIASAMGVGFGGVLIVGGIALIILLESFTPLLTIAVGVFLIGAARMGNRHALVRVALGGRTVRSFLQEGAPAGVPRWIPVSELVADHLLARQERLLPVVEDDRVLGCVSSEDVGRVPHGAWASTPVGQIMRPCEPHFAIDAEDSAEEALARMTRSRLPRLFVLEHGRLLGSVAATDLLAVLALRAR